MFSQFFSFKIFILISETFFINCIHCLQPHLSDSKFRANKQNP